LLIKILQHFSLLLFLSTCASVQQGTLEDSQIITITSTPTNLKIYSNVTLVCSTPCSVKASQIKSSSYLMVKNKDDVIKKINLEKGFNEDMVGNIIYGAGPGVVFDVLSGKLSKYPSKIHINFDNL
jgi:hypothetical protein